ncbi:MAG: RNA 2',3'-cyclic phosphodiesterase [Rhodospirillales bacterium]|jgi:2'-5' RNA ligase|nr:RNA 2',3'-cyclic phosphodiesterase [Rhodospirillales bacterium]
MRLFVGIPLPLYVRDRLAMLASGLPGARWVRPESLHVTLRFIGEVDEGQAEDIDAALAAIRAPAFALTVAGVGCFDRGRQVHAVWAGIEAGPAIGHLHEKVESAVVRCGLAPERRNFKPHVTLARLRNTPVRRVGEYMQTRQGTFGGPFTADRFTLFRSHLGSEGALYEVLVDYPLELVES